MFFTHSEMTQTNHQRQKKRLMKKPYINPTRRGEAKGTVNSIMAKINSAVSCGRNEETQPTIEEIEAELGSGKNVAKELNAYY